MSKDNPKDLAEVLGKHRMAELRKIVNPPGKRGSWLRFLNDSQLAEVFFMLRNGDPPYGVCRYVQKQWGIQVNSSTKSLSRAMTDFRNKAVGEIRKEVFANRGTLTDVKKLEKTAEKAFDKINVLDEYAFMVQTQKSRIKALLELESKSIPMEITDKALANFKDMLDGCVKTAISLGIVDAKPSEFNVNIKTQFDKLLGNPEIGQNTGKLTEACSRFIELLEESSVDLEQNDDGTFIAIDPNKKQNE